MYDNRITEITVNHGHIAKSKPIMGNIPPERVELRNAVNAKMKSWMVHEEPLAGAVPALAATVVGLRVLWRVVR